jgi:hypothetical protein
MAKDDSSVKSLESSLRNPLSYDAIDQMMQTISKKSGISPKELRDKFMKKHNKTPDTYAKRVSEAKDSREYGFEGEMAMSQLKGIIMHANQLNSILKPDTDLPEWLQSKITLAYDYIQTAADYMATEVNEETAHSVHVRTYDKHGEKQINSPDFKKHVTAHGGELDYVSDKGVAFKFKSHSQAAAFHRGVQSRFRELDSEHDMHEDAPVNAVGGGNIAGVGVGPKGEPGVYKKKKKDLVILPMEKRKSFKDFVKKA